MINSKGLYRLFYNHYAELAGITVFLVYILTLGRSIGEFDSGELALAQATLSIPHPTGYPLFTLLGYLFSKIPLPLSTLLKLNLLNAIWCSLTVYFLIKTVHLILTNTQLLLNNKYRENFSHSNPFWLSVVVPSVFSGFMLAFSATFWLQSTKVEVYSLQIFITSVILYNSLKVYLKYENGLLNSYSSVRDILKTWLLIAVLLGFGFSNHLMTVYLLPATIFLFFATNQINKKSIIAFFVLLLISLSIATLFYIAMMVRAKYSPPWAYGDPSNLSRLIDHITAKEYSKYILESSEGLINQGSKLLKMLSFNFSSTNLSFGEFGLSLFLSIAGLILLFFFKRKILIYLYLIISVSFITAFSYNIPDINEYFLVAFLIISLSAGVAVYFLNTLFHTNKFVQTFLITILLVFVLIQVFVNYKYADRSEFFVIEDFLKSTLNSLPSNSILLTDNWGSILSPALYFQNVTNFRRDIVIISPSGMIKFDWYRKNQSLSIFNNKYVLIPRTNLFVTFDVGYNLISKNILKLPQHYTLIPMQNYFLMGIDSVYYPLIKSDYKIRFSNYITSSSENYIRALIPSILEERINYELSFDKVENAKNIFNKLVKEYPEHKFSDITMEALHKSKLIN